MAAVFTAEVLTDMRRLVAEALMDMRPARMRRRQRIPAPSADSTMAGSREATHSEGSPALADSTAAADSTAEAEASTAVAAATEAGATEAGATDSSNEVMKL